MTLQDCIVIDPKLPKGIRTATLEDIKTGKAALAKQYARLVGTPRVGCVVEFQRSFSLFSVSGLLSAVINCIEGIQALFRRKKWRWDNYGWHLAMVSEIKQDGSVIVLEAAGDGVREARLEQFYDRYGRNYRFWDLLDFEITRPQMVDIIKHYAGLKYGYANYFWAGLIYLFRHHINKPLPNVLNDKYTCWELVYAIFRDLGRPLGANDYDCPTLTEFNGFCRGLIPLTNSERSGKQRLAQS